MARPKQERSWESDIKETVALLRSRVTEVEEYSLLRRMRYANPNGYLPYEKAVEWSCASLLACQITFSTVAVLDFVSRVTTYVVQRVAQKQGPAFWLTSDLQSALLETDTPNHVTGMMRVIPCGMLFLPSNSALVSPDGEPVQVIFFSHLLKEEEFTYTLAGQKALTHVENDCVQWGVIMASGTLYAANLGVDQDEGLNLGNNDYRGMVTAEVNISEEDQFLEQVGKLVLQVLLILQTRPDLVEEATPLGFGGTRKQGGRKDQEALLRPRWIGKTYRVRRESFTEPVGTHSSPRMHWRRGHHKRVPVGERSKGQRKWVWIEPVLVNA